MSDQIINIQPIKVKEHEVKQSKYHQVGKLPIRSILLAPSGSGKTVLLQNMILDIYKGCFERIYIFSPSVSIDSTWAPVREYLNKTINLSENEPQLFYDTNDQENLEQIIDTQKK